MKRLFQILFVLCFIQLCAYPTLAQQGGEKNDDGMPSKDEKKAGELPKLALDAPDRLEYVVNLPSLSPAERQEIETPQSPSGPIKVGIHRAVPTKALGDLSPNLLWQPLADGNYGYIEVRSPEAKTVRLGLKLQLPKEARIQIYSVNSKDETLVEHNITQHELLKLGDEVYWTNHVEGEVIGIEIRIPLEENTQNVNVEIITLSHGFTSAAMDFEVPLVHIPCPAHVLAQCAIDSGEVLSGAVNATVMMFFD
ncbi:MAG: hypothetical protein OXC80_14030, partial [Gammaproteobacteria bacterium]|nr:hypothetical protein [Gammaproteobacteria bacterium]